MNCKLASILVVILIGSCRTIPCVESNPTLYFVSFSDPQTDSIVLRKCEKGSAFHTIIDSVIISRNNSIYEKSGDTLHIVTSSYMGEYSLDIQFDYEVYLPLAGKLFQLSNFTEQQTEMKAGLSLDKNVCINPIKSYTVNGQVISGATDYHLIYLKN